MPSSILVVHAAAAIRNEARRCLEQAGHRVDESAELELADASRADLLLVDLAALEPLGEALARLQRHQSARRLIVLAPRRRLDEALKALELGADDCIGVPIAERELVFRVAASLRRPAAALKPETLKAGPVELDRARHRVYVRGQAVNLAPTEFRLMAFFLENPGRVFSRAELLHRAWGARVKAGQRTVDVHVRRLRGQLEPFRCADMIQTVRGFGYRFSPDGQDTRRTLDHTGIGANTL